MLFPGSLPRIGQPTVQGFNRKLDAYRPFGLANEKVAATEVAYAEKAVVIELVSNGHRHTIHLLSNQLAGRTLKTDAADTQEQLLTLEDFWNFSPQPETEAPVYLVVGPRVCREHGIMQDARGIVQRCLVVNH